MTRWQAEVGDAVSVGGRRLHGAGRRGEIVEVLGEAGHVRYRVRWEDGRESIFHPGPDAVLEPRRRRPSPRTAAAAKPMPKVKAKAKATPARPRPRTRAQARVGDRIVVRGHHLGEPDRDGEILEVAADGGPPFRVRWSDSGREVLLFPGPDALVEHFRSRRKRAR